MKSEAGNPWTGISKPAKDFDYKLVDNKHPLKLMWGVNFKGDYLFCYEAKEIYMPKEDAFPKLRGIDAKIIDHNGNKVLILILNDSKEWEIFKFLCIDLVMYTKILKNTDDIASVILGKLIRWQKFWKKERKNNLSPAEIKGLFGELFFLKNQCARNFGFEKAIKCWVGPEGAPQDFAISDVAVEVKCQSGSTKPTVAISSPEQLHPQLREGFLVVYTVAISTGDVGGALSLNQMVRSVKNELINESTETRERFEDLLDNVGYLDLEFYDKDLFLVTSEKSYKLGGDFPAIKLGAIPPAVDKVRYNLNLEACAGFVAQPSWWK